jgi:hypothetical protein
MYRWWTFNAGNSPVYGLFLKLGPVSILRWTGGDRVYWELCCLERLIWTVRF